MAEARPEPTVTVRRISKAAARTVCRRDRSIADRLLVNLRGRQRKLLGTALCTAADQLELLTPVAMGPGGPTHLLRVAPVVMVQRGMLLVILAEAGHCITTFCLPKTVPVMFDECVQMAAARGLPPSAYLCLIHEMVALYGAPPGERAAETPPDHVMPVVLGVLLSALPAGGLAKLATAVEAIRRDGVCPAMVGVIGPSSSGAADSYSGAWPLVLPVAEYADDFAPTPPISRVPQPTGEPP